MDGRSMLVSEEVEGPKIIDARVGSLFGSAWRSPAAMYDKRSGSRRGWVVAAVN